MLVFFIIILYIAALSIIVVSLTFSSYMLVRTKIYSASNTFFLQFPNCLAYETKKECVEKIKFALENDPVPLSKADKHKLTWEGANTRLYESSLMTEAEAEERNKKTGDFARLHMDTMKTGAFFQGLWARGAIVTNKITATKMEKTEGKEKAVGLWEI